MLVTVVAVAVAHPFCFGACVLVSEAHGHSPELRSKRRIKSKQARSEVPGCIAQEADMVIEAAVERLDIKQAVFAELEKVCRPDCVLSSNTSTINLDLISAKMRGRDRVVGAHFFSPAHVMPLLEIVRTDHSSPQVCASPPPPLHNALPSELTLSAVQAGSTLCPLQSYSLLYFLPYLSVLASSAYQAVLVPGRLAALLEGAFLL
jgi:hypothetical protein